MATYQLKPDLLLQKVADEMVLLEPESGEYFTLNSVGADMLELMQQGKSAPEILLKDCFLDLQLMNTAGKQWNTVTPSLTSRYDSPEH